MPTMPHPDEPSAHPWIWLVYVALFGAAVPWYLPDWAAERTWFGFPVWVTVSLLATVGVALFTAFVIERYWGEDDGRE